MRLRDTGSLSVVCGMPSVSSALRVKPASARGKRTRRSAVPVLRGGQTSRYVVDSVLAETASQQHTYQTLVAPLVDSFVQGENVVLLAYGATSTGKSYTLQGGTDSGNLSVSGDDAGMILRATHAILRALSIVPKAKYCLSVAYCGLSVGHDAQLLDLLSPAPASAAVSLRDGSAAAALAGLTAWSVEDPCDVLEALRSRRLLQSTGGTGYKGSKRGSMHTMLTLQLDSYEADGTPLQHNTLSFVELAALEPKDPLNGGRTSGTESASARSLAVAYSTLSKVLAALRNTSAGAGVLGQPAAAGSAAQQQQQQQLLQHVPWRDSPLTRWLQEQLHAANAILVLGTISTEVEAATDCLTTVSWVSRFSAASRSGSDGVIASFAWEALADPEAGTGSYIRFQPDPYDAPYHSSTHQAAAAHGSYMPDPCSALCSSPMAKLGSPNLHYCESAGSPRSHNRPRSAGSVCQTANRWPTEQQQQQQGQVVRRRTSPLRGSQNMHPWHLEQLHTQGTQQQQQQGVRSSAGVPPPVTQQQQQQQQFEGGNRPYQSADTMLHKQAVGAVFSSLGQLGATGGAGVGPAHEATAAAVASSASAGGVSTPQRAQGAAAAAAAAAGGPAGQASGTAQHEDCNHQHQQQQQQQQPSQQGVDDEVLLYGELMTALRRGGGSLRAEAILEQLLQELGAARAALSSERGEGRAMRARLQTLEEQHSGCADSKKMLQEQVVELQKQLDTANKQLSEVSTDRDLFLRRLQQLELEGREGSEGGNSSGGGSSLDMQRQKAHAAQLRMMEAELNALSSSNQQLRSQLELSAQQVSAAGRDKLAAQDAAAEASGRLQQKLTMAQQEIDMLRSAAEIEVAVRKEMETTADELRRALDATADELASVTAAKATLEQQHREAQESIDALVAELQETLASLEQEQHQAAQLAEKLDALTAEGAGAQQQLTAAQDQVSNLQGRLQQLEQQQQELEAQHNSMAAQKRDLLDAMDEQQAKADKTGRLLQDLQSVFSDFELDLNAALPQHWQQLTKGTASDAGKVSPHSIKLRSRLLALLSHGSSTSTSIRSGGGSNTRPGSPGRSKAQGGSSGGSIGSNAGGCGSIDPALPSAWAGKLQAVVEVLELAGQERGHVCEEFEAARQRVQLLETNVQELQKLVSTQECLQQQLATQVDTNSAKAQAQQLEVQKLTVDLEHTRKQLDEAQSAVVAVTEELQASQQAVKAAEASKARSDMAVADRDAALDALADELVAVSGACDEHAAAREQAEEQVVSLATELEEALLQLCTREKLLEQIWAQLRGVAPQPTAAAAADVSEPKAAVAKALSRTEELQRLRQQQKQRWMVPPRGAAAGVHSVGSWQGSLTQSTGLGSTHQQQQQGKQASVAGLVRRLSSNSDANAPAAGIMQQAVQAAMRRSSQCSDGEKGAGSGHAVGDAAAGKGYRLQQHQQQQQQHLGQKPAHQQQRQQDQMQAVVVDAVRQLREQVASLQQQLEDARANREGCEDHLLQQLQQLQALNAQQQAEMAQVQEQKARLQSEVVSLGQHLIMREQELRQAQLNCQELDAALQHMQQQLMNANAKHHQQQQQQQQLQALAMPGSQQQPQMQQSLSDPLAPTTPQTAQVRLQEAELQLADCRKQLSEARLAAADAAAALAAERAARVAAEDRDAGWQGLLDRLAALQGEVEGLHAALLQEKRAVVALRDELTLMATSRDTWRDAAKRAEVKMRDAQAATEQRSTELTRARAEVLQLRQELSESTQQLLLIGRAQTAAQRSTGGGTAPEWHDATSDGGNVEETLAARLATAQVLKREAEDRAAELARKLSAAQARLAEMQQQQDDSEADMGSQLYQVQAQLVRAKADLAASKAAAAVAAVARSNEGSVLNPLHGTAQFQQQQQQQGRGGDGVVKASGVAFGADRQRSVQAQLEAAEQLVRSMRATAAAALTDATGTPAAAAAVPSASMVSTGATPTPQQQQQQQQHDEGGSRYQSPVNESCTSPFKAYSNAAGSLEQHLIQQQQQSEAGGRGGAWGSGSGSKPSSPKGGWLYQRLFASKDSSSRGNSTGGASPAAATAGTAPTLGSLPAAAAAGGGGAVGGLKAGQPGSGVWRQAGTSSGGGVSGVAGGAAAAAGAEAPCLY